MYGVTGIYKDPGTYGGTFKLAPQYVDKYGSEEEKKEKRQREIQRAKSNSIQVGATPATPIFYEPLRSEQEKKEQQQREILRSKSSPHQGDATPFFYQPLKKPGFNPSAPPLEAAPPSYLTASPDSDEPIPTNEPELLNNISCHRAMGLISADDKHRLKALVTSHKPAGLRQAEEELKQDDALNYISPSFSLHNLNFCPDLSQVGYFSSIVYAENLDKQTMFKKAPSPYLKFERSRSSVYTTEIVGNAQEAHWVLVDILMAFLGDPKEPIIIKCMHEKQSIGECKVTVEELVDHSGKFLTQSSQAINGFLEKQGKGTGMWKKRFCVIETNYLLYYTDKDSKTCKGSIYLTQTSVEKGDGKEFNLKTKNRVYIFRSETIKERENWIKVIRTAANIDDREIPEVRKALVNPKMTKKVGYKNSGLLVFRRSHLIQPDVDKLIEGRDTLITMDINVKDISYRSTILSTHSPIAIFFRAHKNHKTPWYANLWEESNVKTKSEKKIDDSVMWEPLTTDLYSLCYGDKQWPIMIKVFSEDNRQILVGKTPKFTMEHLLPSGKGGSKSITMELINPKKKGTMGYKHSGTMTISNVQLSKRIPECKDATNAWAEVVTMYCEIKKISRPSMLGKPSPFLKILVAIKHYQRPYYNKNPEKKWRLLYTTESIKKTTEGKWQPIKTDKWSLCEGDEERPICIRCYHAKTIIGEMIVTFSQLVEQEFEGFLINKVKQGKGTYKNSGELKILTEVKEAASDSPSGIFGSVELEKNELKFTSLNFIMSALSLRFGNKVVKKNKFTAKLFGVVGIGETVTENVDFYQKPTLNPSETHISNYCIPLDALGKRQKHKPRFYGDFNLYVQIWAEPKGDDVLKLLGECCIPLKKILRNKQGGCFLVALTHGESNEGSGNGLIKFQQGRILPYHPEPEQ